MASFEHAHETARILSLGLAQPRLVVRRMDGEYLSVHPRIFVRKKRYGWKLVAQYDATGTIIHRRAYVG